jgi:ABC-type uncharacterized transport system involved in gliding motility auxiliary subunit
MKFLNSLDRTKLTAASLVVAGLFLFFVNILSTQTIHNAQVDLTQSKLFTLAEGSRKIIRTIDEPITFRFYYSRKLGEQSSSHGNYSKRVRELLEHYAEIANGKIDLKIINPEPFSVEEDEAVRLGIQGIPLDQSGEQAYFGLAATNSTDDRRTVPFFNPQREQFLEYDVTRLIYELANPDKKKVGLLSSLPLEADPQLQYQPWPILQQISQFFEISSLDNDQEVIPDDISVLFIAHPKNLRDKALYAIDQYVMRGGKAVVLIDPYNESVRVDPRRPGGAGPSDLNRLFDTWGIQMTDGKFVGDRTHAVRVSAPIRGRDTVIDYLSWNQFDKRNVNTSDVVTGQLNAIMLASAGALSATEASGLKMTPLIQTSTEAALLSTEFVQDMPNPQALMDAFKSEDKKFTLAARFAGKVKSAFPDGPPPPDPRDAEKPADPNKPKLELKPHLKESQEPINLIVVGDTDFITARFWLQEQKFFGQQVSTPIANNADFVVNSLDNLSGSEDLISLRSRGLSVRPFYRIINIRNKAEENYRAKEQELQARLKGLQEKVSKLKINDEEGTQALLTTQQRRDFDQSRAELLSVRKELRDVQLALRQDIERLDNILKVVNIWTMPVLVAIIAIVLAVFRRRRYRQQTIQG